MKLFAIYIGGIHKKALVEVHDVRFIVAETIQDTYEQLRKAWWGEPESLHLDAWAPITHIDGFEVSLEKAPPVDNTYKLFFLNLGGYDANQLTELHKNVLVVAESEGKAKVKALKKILDWQSYHRDYQYDVDKIINLEHVLTGQSHYIHLQPCGADIPIQFNCKYVPIGSRRVFTGVEPGDEMRP